MGNEQSNENTRRKNFKIFRVTSKSSHSGWIRYHLDDYINYSDGNYKHIDFDDRVVGPNGLIALASVMFNAPSGPNSVFPKERDYVRIDLDEVRNHSSSYNFSPYSCPLSIIGREEIDSEGNVSIVAAAREVCQEIIEVRERRAAATEWANFDKQMQQAWQLQPPKK